MAIANMQVRAFMNRSSLSDAGGGVGDSLSGFI
jgi:hypothetical protein